MSNIFYNDSIYDSNQDYVLGGFIVEDNTIVNYATISNAVSRRLEVLIEDFYIRGWAANTSTNVEYTQEDAMVQIAFMIKDNLGVFPEGLNMANLHSTILNSEKMIKWLDETIKGRVEQYLKTEIPTNYLSEKVGIPSLAEKIQYSDIEKYEEAATATYETTLEQFIEELSLIEL